MADRGSTTAGAVMLAALTAGAMIANQIGGKATRDALFLSNFDVTRLPTMLLASAAASVVVILLLSRAMTRVGPARVVPLVFLSSAVLFVAEWWLFGRSPKAIAVILFLHIATLGAALVSGFWSIINERFDPRTARKQIGRIGAGATLGGLMGGILAERVASLSTTSTMLLLLGLLHLLCAALLRAVASGGSRRSERRMGKEPDALADKTARGEGLLHGLKTLGKVAYLRQLASLVLVTTIGATLIDYVFKTHAAASYADGQGLLRFFAIFYTAVSACTFLVQALFARRSLERFGLARTAATLPGGIALGSLAAIAAPGLAGAVAARGGESILRSSLFRSGYELFYTPLPAGEKRSTKTLVDVGFERLGDAVGAGLIRAILLLGPAIALTILLVAAFVLAIAGLYIARLLQQGYVHALGKSLRDQAVELDLSMVEDSTTRSMILQTVHAIDLPRSGERSGARSPDRSSEADPEGRADREGSLPTGDATARAVLDLRSADLSRIRAVLGDRAGVEPILVGHILPLLAWDEVCEDAIRALCRVSGAATGQLVDRLLDPSEEDAIRRRVPRVLASSRSQRAVDGLFAGLDDPRFEVRYQCGRALSKERRGVGSLMFEPGTVFSAVLREVKVGRPVWESRRLLDDRLDRDDSPILDEVIRQRSNRSLEHVFTLLSLALPEDALWIAYRGLHTDDSTLRGTALEYLEGVLPASIRESLWPFLDDQRTSGRHSRPTADSLEELLRSQKSIQINLAALREQGGFDDPKDD